MKKYVIALDEGTTSARTVIFDKAGGVVSSAQHEFRQIYPKPGYVEQDANEIYACQYSTITEAVFKSGISPDEIAAIGITNQRETTVVWEKATGKPVYNAIVWQCRRTADVCEALKARGLTDHIKAATGLIPDAYFSATKIKWILDNVDGARERAKSGELLFGTIDTWLVWNLTGGRVHVTDVTNASRTMLFDIHKLAWDQTLLSYFDIPACMLPKVVPSSGIVGYTDPDIVGGSVPIAGIAGDQQAALFGQCCFAPGEVKNTYGTGCFTLMNTGEVPVESHHGLVTTIAYGIDGKVNYALEGSVFIAGAALQWLRDEVRLIHTAPESEEISRSVPDTGGVYVVPAFTGLGAPYWQPAARGMIVGLTRGSDRARLVRATLESLAYQVHDLVKAMESDLGHAVPALKVDGGASANDFLLQFQADLLQVDIERPVSVESTALGATYLAGLAVGFWKSPEDVKANRSVDRVFAPVMEPAEREKLLAGWKKAVACALLWGED